MKEKMNKKAGNKKLLLNAKFQQLLKKNIYIFENFLRFWIANSKEISLDYNLLMI
jgi:hypothetical protein